MFPTFDGVLALSLFVSNVLAGNRAWERPMKHTIEIRSAENPYLFTGENSTIARRAYHAESRKRWVTIKPGGNNADAKLWPNREITYCFEDDATRTATFDDLKEAKQLWTDSGLSEAFKWTQGSDSFCGNTANRSKFLLISFNTEGKLATTVGVPPLQDGVNAGPRMKISNSLNVGMLNVVANYAHEIGHAWGLHHEHQNPRFWGGEAYSESGGSLWGDSRWNCQNLKDYDTALADLKSKWTAAEAQAKMNLACRKRANALAIKFSAFDYLPILDEAIAASSKEVPDYDSIMIYPSGGGGKPDSSQSDSRASILVKADGSRINPVLKPSERDIKGLTDLYGGKVAAKLTLYGDKASKYKQSFSNLRKKDPESGCN